VTEAVAAKAAAARTSAKRRCSFAPERAILKRRSGAIIAGIDEAGRGPLAGPVVAAAVILPVEKLPRVLSRGLDDSKKLRPERREELYAAIVGCTAIRYGVGRAEVDEIDTINILQATYRAMARAMEALSHEVHIAIVDGNRAPPLPCAVETLIGGDGLSLSVAAASILAKVTRDRYMRALHLEHPGYGWDTNVGYGTDEHRAAILSLGLTPHHRRSFAPVQMALPFGEGGKETPDDMTVAVAEAAT
jgi:ribonuclease HII